MQEVQEVGSPKGQDGGPYCPCWYSEKFGGPCRFCKEPVLRDRQPASFVRPLPLTENSGRQEDLIRMNPLDVQVGGNHYKEMKIQPVEFIMANKLGFCEGNAVKYLCRFRTKNGIEDLLKAKHYIEMLIQQEENDKS